MKEPDFLLFASDATLLGIAGVALLLIALAAMFGERRRLRRKAIDAVGWMPWTTVSVACFFVGTILLAMAGSGWLGG